MRSRSVRKDSRSRLWTPCETQFKALEHGFAVAPSAGATWRSRACPLSLRRVESCSRHNEPGAPQGVDEGRWEPFSVRVYHPQVGKEMRLGARFFPGCVGRLWLALEQRTNVDKMLRISFSDSILLDPWAGHSIRSCPSTSRRVNMITQHEAPSSRGSPCTPGVGYLESGAGLRRAKTLFLYGEARLRRGGYHATSRAPGSTCTSGHRHHLPTFPEMERPPPFPSSWPQHCRRSPTVPVSPASRRLRPPPQVWRMHYAPLVSVHPTRYTIHVDAGVHSSATDTT